MRTMLSLTTLAVLAQAANPDGLITGLANLGGTGILAAALLWLHSRALDAFRQELATERAEASRKHDAVMNLLDDLHEDYRDGKGCKAPLKLTSN